MWTAICISPKHRNLSCRLGACSRPAKGFTLLELLVVLAFVAILTSATGVSLRGLQETYRLRSASDLLFSHLLFARSEAIKRNTRVVLCKSSTGMRCAFTGDWGQGWIVFTDQNDNAQVDVGEDVLLRQDSYEMPLSISGNTNVAKYISYTSLGSTKLVSGAFQAGTITICNKSQDPNTRQIVINNVGRPRVIKNATAVCSHS